MIIALLIAAALAAVSAPAQAATTVIRVAPKSIDFGTKKIGLEPLYTTYYDSVKITNSSREPLDVLVTAGLPDDFGFGLLPGSDCPVLAPDELARGESCQAVVRFTPTPFFADWLQEGSLTITATRPGSTEVVAVVEVPVTGTGKL
ncbi:MAG TPA: hypothetical protein VGJ95_16470 [Pseudonocardiaceae bacterium]|jgi:hypothetical protein